MVLLLKDREFTGIQDGLSVERVHMVGIGGTGPRGLAGILSKRGIQVSGSEMARTPAVDFLRQQGLKCWVGHRREHLLPDTQLVLISAAVRKDNPEVVEARRLGIPILKYAELLGVLMRERLGVAVAGTHGKTTTTAMASQVLMDAGKDPAFIIGGDYPAIGGSAKWGRGDYFVAEACEFDRSFLNLYPTLAIITNIEEDHLDYFSSLEEIKGAFREFVQHIPENGYLVLNGDDAHSRLLADHATCSVGRFSLQRGNGDWWSENIRAVNGGVAFEATSREGDEATVTLKVPGIHNVKNSLGVLTLLRRLGVPLESIVRSLERFSGVRRRFEVLLRDPAIVIDDYAHHPTEVEMVLKAARETFPGRRIRAVFQPHQYSRTFKFLKDFARVLSSADEVIITDVFAARDSMEDIRRVNSPALVDAMAKNGRKARYAGNFTSVLKHILKTLGRRDVFLFLGAGDVTSLARKVSKILAEPTGEDA